MTVHISIKYNNKYIIFFSCTFQNTSRFTTILFRRREKSCSCKCHLQLLLICHEQCSFPLSTLAPAILIFYRFSTYLLYLIFLQGLYYQNSFVTISVCVCVKLFCEITGKCKFSKVEFFFFVSFVIYSVI